MLPIRTERLVVRMLREADAAVLASYRNDPGVAELQAWALPFTIDDARRLAAGQADLDGPTEDQWVQLALEHGQVVVGDLAVHLHPGGHEATLGYSLAPAHQGRGYATEGVAAVVDALIARGVHRLTASLDPRNVRSMMVLERVGFTFECRARRAVVVRGEGLDDVRYSMLADDRLAWADRDRSHPSDVVLAEITPDDAALWGELGTHHSQARYVAPVLASFRDALFPAAVDGAPVVPWMRGVLADGERVGFVMTTEVTATHREPYLWRLLIDRRHQRRGIAQRVIALLVERARTQGATELLTSWVEGPAGPRRFYERLGFVPTGRTVDGEVEARLVL